MAKAVFCMATTFLQAEQIVDKLKIEGFSSNDISVLFPDTHGSKDLSHEKLMRQALTHSHHKQGIPPVQPVPAKKFDVFN